jgi:hypothetical protein
MKIELLDRNLSENQMEEEIAQFFSWYSLGCPMRLQSISEQSTGADKQVSSKIYGSIFMQFKVSEGFSLKPPEVYRDSALKNIIQFRLKNDLLDDPILFFKLRRKAKTAKDLQHNILMKMNDPKNNTYGIYVAPLTLDKDEYNKQLFPNMFARHFPFIIFNHKLFRLSEQQILESSLKILSQAPILKYHFSIAPHERVINEKHYYSYSTNATNICWHSDKYFEEINISRLSDFFYNLSENILYNEFNLSKLCNNLNDILQLDSKVNDNDLFGFLKLADKYLYNNYKIKHYLITVNSKGYGV